MAVDDVYRPTFEGSTSSAVILQKVYEDDIVW